MRRYILLTLLCVGMVFGVLAEQPKYGGTLRYATIGEPPHLDLMLVTSDLASTIGQHIFETLFTFDEHYAPIPLLVDTYEVRSDGREIVLHLRQGILFHNGKELQAEDVVASLERWGKYGIRGPIMFQHVTAVVADDKYTVRILFETPFGPWQSLLAFNNGGPMIIPKEIAEAAGGKPLTPDQYIGTGPYKFAEWIPGKYIRLVRFEGYKSREEPPTGYGGARHAYLDEILFIPVPEAGTRLAGVQAGDFDYAEMIPADLYSVVKADPNINTYLLRPPFMALLFRNTKQGIMANNLMLQAVLAALDMEPIMKAAFGELFELNGSIFPKGTIWYSTAGTERYNQANLDKAKELLKEAGYAGEPIRLLTNTSYQYMYQYSLVIADQLRKAGMNIELRVYDWATMVKYRAQSGEWDLFVTSHGPIPDPALLTALSPTYPGWWDTPQKNELVNLFNTTVDFKDRYAIWEKIQALWYEEGSCIKLGDFYTLNISSAKRVGGLDDPHQPPLLWPYFWNAWLKG